MKRQHRTAGIENKAKRLDQAQDLFGNDHKASIRALRAGALETVENIDSANTEVFRCRTSPSFQTGY